MGENFEILAVNEIFKNALLLFHRKIMFKKNLPLRKYVS